MKDLSVIRKEIDELDNKIIPLLEERMDKSLDVAEYKKANNVPVLNVERENQILCKMKEKSQKYGNEIAQIYEAIMQVSREIQYEAIGLSDDLFYKLCNGSVDSLIADGGKVACQGVEGAYSATAADSFFGGADKLFFEHFSEAFDALANNKCKALVVPIENSIAGSVNEVYDLISNHSFYINRALQLPIAHVLAAKKGTTLNDVKQVYSHPQALAQCNGFIANSNFMPCSYSNTALAAKMVSESDDSTIACICSEDAATRFNLEIIARNIQNNNANTTRFVMISREFLESEDADTISISFSIPDEIGSLNKILNRFSTLGLNMTKIESRPIMTQNFKYIFYIDFNGNIRDKKIARFITSLEEEVKHFTFLGNYKEVLL